jgi:hypothetical protein
MYKFVISCMKKILPGNVPRRRRRSYLVAAAAGRRY